MPAVLAMPAALQWAPVQPVVMGFHVRRPNSATMVTPTFAELVMAIVAAPAVVQPAVTASNAAKLKHATIAIQPLATDATLIVQELIRFAAMASWNAAKIVMMATRPTMAMAARPLVCVLEAAAMASFIPYSKFVMMGLPMPAEPAMLIAARPVQV